MREILFKGQRVDNGQWVYGSFVSYEKTFGIIEKENIEYTCDGGALEFLYTEVRFDTVSQFTGLLDKKGNKIFEGDRVKFHYFYQGVYYGGAIECEIEVEGVIEITSLGLFLKCENPDDGGYLLFYQPHEDSFEKIGNIHE
ncbi:hypothetical protein AS589_09335 [Empedobacter brevis]|uniref:YopX family protein n=1 Tax=Empedobacter brevis TaxID=247 RepID=UPI00131F5B30|nr:YopX family protein [Empedobacter brevis]QHC84958.1 hypothetical protein AS589_09335 [Empedobacter brevis]